MGASGQVGSMIVEKLSINNPSVRAIMRNPQSITTKNVEILQADLFNEKDMFQAMKEGETAFLLTPEDPTSNDIIGDTEKIVTNYRNAIEANGIRRVVALSCVGAQIKAGTGNILMSRMLEQSLADLPIEKIYVRPSYYYSNWLGFLDTVQKHGVLPSFLPADLNIEMNSPQDVADFIAEIIMDDFSDIETSIYELVGPRKYSPKDVAEYISKILGKSINLEPIPQVKWKESLIQAGFTENASENLIEMTQALIDNVAKPEFPDCLNRLSSPLDSYLKDKIGH